MIRCRILILFLFSCTIGLSCDGSDTGRESVAAQAARIAEKERQRVEEQQALHADRQRNLDASRAALAAGELTRARAALDLVLKIDRTFPGALETLSALKTAETEARSAREAAALEEKERTLLAKAKALPASEAEALRKLYFDLWRLRPQNKEYERRYERYLDAAQAATQERSRAAARARADLEIVRWQWGREHGFTIAEGRVKNVSARPLRNVQAVIEYFTKSGEFITASTALIEHDPVLPGQTSPFKVITRGNPAMTRASIAFKTLGGGTLDAYER